MDLPPTRAHDVWQVDSVRAPTEYWGSVTLPLANLSAQAVGGQIYVSVTEPPTASSTRRVHVYVDQMPVSVNSHEVALYVDAHRFDTGPAGLGTDDVRYIVDLASGDARAERVNWSAGGAFRWTRIDPRGLEARLGVCRSGQGSAGDVRVCNLELAFNLPRGHSQPAAGDVEGIGFAFSDDLRSVVMPEELAEPAADELQPLVDRRRYMTLLFRRPDAVPFSVMNWNMAHWGRDFEWDQTNSPYRHVTLEEFAQVMADYDIVGVQEMWSTADARELLGLINIERRKNGLPPDFLYGPVTHHPSILDKLTQSISEPQGGVFIYSRFAQVAQDTIVYHACRGEDCFKTKGALWVRLDLSSVLREGRDVACDQNAADFGCPSTPTHELYLDVFNTHLQAGGNAVCDGLDDVGDYCAGAGLGSGLAGFIPVVGPAAAPALAVAATACTAATGVAMTLLCRKSPIEVRTSQLAQLDSFIEAVQAGSRPHYSLVLGDLNTNGRTLNRDRDRYREDGCLGEYGDGDHSGRYGEMLTALGVAASSSPDVVAPDDTINPHPEAFDWDIDHGDVAREMDYDWEHCGRSSHPGESGPVILTGATPDGGVGDPIPPPDCTDRWSADPPLRVITDGGTAAPDTCPQAPCELRSDPRLDYILVRPPALPSEGLFEPPGYLMARRRGADGADLPQWTLLWPAVEQDASAHLCLAAGYDPSADEVAGLRRLSDHAPIVANLELGILREPTRFHPGWPHDLVVRVETYDATGETDCWRDLCGPLDPYVFWWGHRVDPTGLSRNFVPLDNMESDRCSGWSGSYPAKSCMDTWVLTDHVEPGTYLEHRIKPTLFDDDGLHGDDDPYGSLADGGDPFVKVRWSTREILVSRHADRDDAPPDFHGPVRLDTTDPWRWCTRTGEPVFLCYRVSTLEARP